MKIFGVSLMLVSLIIFIGGDPADKASITRELSALSILIGLLFFVVGTGIFIHAKKSKKLGFDPNCVVDQQNHHSALRRKG